MVTQGWRGSSFMLACILNTSLIYSLHVKHQTPIMQKQCEKKVENMIFAQYKSANPTSMWYWMLLSNNVRAWFLWSENNRNPRSYTYSRLKDWSAKSDNYGMMFICVLVIKSWMAIVQEVGPHGKCSSLKCALAFQCEGLHNNHTSLKHSNFFVNTFSFSFFGYWSFWIEYENMMSHYIEEVHEIKWCTKII